MTLTPTTTVLYEIDFNDLTQLPPGMQVLKQGAHGGYFIQQTGIDNITCSPGARFFLFKYPPLPKVQSFEASTSKINTS